MWTERSEPLQKTRPVAYDGPGPGGGGQKFTTLRPHVKLRKTDNEADSFPQLLSQQREAAWTK